MILKPTLSLFTADNYTEYDTDGFIQFQAVDPTLASYTIAINNITISSGNISSNELIEISNANYSVGEHIVTLLPLDRANNSLIATTSFNVNAYVTNITTTIQKYTTSSTNKKLQILSHHKRLMVFNNYLGCIIRIRIYSKTKRNEQRTFHQLRIY